jgi:hypothetical protein
MVEEWCAVTGEIPAASIQTAMSAPADMMSFRMGFSRWLIFAGYFAGTAVVWPQMDFSTGTKT